MTTRNSFSGSANEVSRMGNGSSKVVRDEGDDNEDDDVFTRCY